MRLQFALGPDLVVIVIQFTLLAKANLDGGLVCNTYIIVYVFEPPVAAKN